MRHTRVVLVGTHWRANINGLPTEQFGSDCVAQFGSDVDVSLMTMPVTSYPRYFGGYPLVGIHWRILFT